MAKNDLTEYLKCAFEYKNNSEYKKSIDYFYKALAIDNESSEIMTELADLYSKLMQNDRAVGFYEQILLKDKNNNEIKLKYAKLLKQIKEYDKAVKILSELYEESYNQEETAQELFGIYSLQNNNEKIISEYNKYSNVIHDSVVLYYTAKAYSALGKEDIAQELYKKSFYNDSNNISSGIEVADYLFSKGQIDEAEKLALQLLSLKEDEKIFYLLAEISYKKIDMDSAIKYYSYAIRINPKNALYYFRLAIVFSLKGFFKEAEESYCTAISIEPQNEIYNYALAYLYYMNKKFDLSEKLVDYILIINAENYKAVVLKTLLLIEKNDLASAGRLIEELDETSENDDFSYYVQAMYYSKLNLFEKAVEFILKAIENNNESLEYKYQLAVFYYQLKKFDESINVCNEIVNENDKFINVYILLSKNYLKLTLFDKVQENINILLNLDKNQPEAYSVLAISYYENGEYEKAADNFKIALSINPNKEEYFAKIAHCFYNLENYKDAFNYFKEAADFDITNADYRYYMAKCAVKNNDKDSALANFSVMKRLAPHNIEYIKEYASYLKEINSKQNAVSIIKTLIKQAPKEYKNNLQEFLELLKK